jgi:hypothetical protein
MTDTASERRVATDTASVAESWWDWRLFGSWILVNGAAFVVIPVVAILLERLASAATHDLVHDRRPLAVLIIAVLGWLITLSLHRQHVALLHRMKKTPPPPAKPAAPGAPAARPEPPKPPHRP